MTWCVCTGMDQTAAPLSFDKLTELCPEAIFPVTSQTDNVEDGSWARLKFEEDDVPIQKAIQHIRIIEVAFC